MRTDVLFIDLSAYDYWVEDREDLLEYLGGTGAGIKLLQENLKKGAHPLSEENVIVLATGPFTPAYPMASKSVALFKSPLNNSLGESHAGGRCATAIANAGYLAIVLKGRAEEPVYVVVDNQRVYFRDARAIWQVRDALVVGRIIAAREKGRGVRSVLRIGAAGTNLVRFSCVTTETYRHFGRLGLGAVFGSKNLKALVVIGSGSFKPRDIRGYREVYGEIFSRITEWKEAKKYYTLGTAANVLPLNEMGALPTRNLRECSFEYASELSGEAFAERLLGRRIACSHCPVACIHIGVLRLEYGDEPYFYRTLMVGYDYELIYALGSMLGIKSPEEVLRLICAVEKYGLDAISTGVALAWATEAYERGIVSKDETKVELGFGNTESYLRAVEYLSLAEGEFYRELGRGVESAAMRYSGEEFALSFGGNEMPGYCTGYGAYVGYLIGSRHSHLDTGGYELDQKLLAQGRSLNWKELVDTLIQRETEKQLLSSLVVCFFARKIYSPEIVSRALSPLGIELKEDELIEISRKIYTEKQKFKKREGFNPENLRIPERIIHRKTIHGDINKEFIIKSLRYFNTLLLDV